MKHATSHAAELDLLALGGGGLLYDGEAPAYLRDARLAHDISGTYEAHSSYHVMPIALATGHVAARLENETP
jgi:hypothetical protein